MGDTGTTDAADTSPAGTGNAADAGGTVPVVTATTTRALCPATLPDQNRAS